MKRDDREEQQWAGREWINYAYSLGCLAALGDREAPSLLSRMLDAAKAGRTMRHALLTEYRAGTKHERARGCAHGESR
jgi:hypothetical protein